MESLGDRGRSISHNRLQCSPIARIVRKYSSILERRREREERRAALSLLLEDRSVSALIKFILTETNGRFGTLHARESDCLNALSIFLNQEILQRE